MPLMLGFHTKYILNPWSMSFNPAKVSLMAFAVLFKIPSTHCDCMIVFIFQLFFQCVQILFKISWVRKSNSLSSMTLLFLLKILYFSVLVTVAFCLLQIWSFLRQFGPRRLWNSPPWIVTVVFFSSQLVLAINAPVDTESPYFRKLNSLG